MENNCTTIDSGQQLSPKSIFCGIKIFSGIPSAVKIIREEFRGVIIIHKASPIKLFIVFAAATVINLNTYSQSQNEIDYAIHANIVYRFTKYIDWPDNKKSGDFIIGIVGDSPLYEQLKNFITNKKVGNQKIVLKKFPSSLSAYDCHILFITEEKSNSLKRIAENTKGTSTLLVSESNGLARKGSCINFIVIEDHLKLEINKTNIEERDLNIATELLSLGIIVK
jgi:hypothetical protein